MKKKGSQGQSDQAKQIFQAGYNYVRQQPGFEGVLREVQIYTDHDRPMAKRDWAFVTSGGDLYINFRITGSPGEWAYILAHCCLHLALGHFQSERLGDSLWNLACDCSVARFLAESKIGTPPPEISDTLKQTMDAKNILLEQDRVIDFPLKPSDLSRYDEVLYD